VRTIDDENSNKRMKTLLQFQFLSHEV